MAQTQAKAAADLAKIRSGNMVLVIAQDKTIWTGMLARDATLAGPGPVDGGAAPHLTNMVQASAAVLHCFAEEMGFRKGSTKQACVDSCLAWFQLRGWGSDTNVSAFWCHGMCTCTPEVQKSETEKWELVKTALPLAVNKQRRVACSKHPAATT